MDRPLILGIDPGTRVLGYGIVQPEPLRCVECGILTAHNRSQTHRLAELAADIRGLVAEFPAIGLMALEDTFIHPRHRKDTAIALGRIQGVCLAIASACRIEPVIYAPTTIKRTVTGKGNATKAEVARVVMGLFGFTTQPKPDATDALAVALTACAA
ncbi:MAG: crossover junction endodeoxyribonuclease RuvC [Proteobacteria bacterium]|nr:crossover junction endodeoxyribonuclease RuvC [Pseudomonadota bacterium]